MPAISSCVPLMVNLPRRWSACLLIAAFAAGCGTTPVAPPPVTHPVKGRLLDKAGQPVTGGALQIVSSNDIPVSAMGEVRPDGTFELAVLSKSGQKLAGAEAGQYKATYIPVMSAAQTEAPIDLPQPITIEARENVLELRLP